MTFGAAAAAGVRLIVWCSDCRHQYSAERFHAQLWPNNATTRQHGRRPARACGLLENIRHRRSRVLGRAILCSNLGSARRFPKHLCGSRGAKLGAPANPTLVHSLATKDRSTIQAGESKRNAKASDRADGELHAPAPLPRRRFRTERIFFFMDRNYYG